MRNTEFGISRRQLLGGLLSGAALGLSGLASAQPNSSSYPAPPMGVSPAGLARDENYWRQVATYYDRTAGIVNLEHGYWGKMARPVQDAYITATRMVNAQNSFYARKQYGDDSKIGVQRIARALGAQDGEIVLTRNATEAIHNLIRQYRGLQPGDAVLYADVDYPAFKNAMDWLETSRGAQTVEVELPSRADQQQILRLYLQAFDANPRLKLMLITHVSNQHGLVVPVAEIATEARSRGIDVICDNAQS